MLGEISLDSLKHARMYEAALKLLGGEGGGNGGTVEGAGRTPQEAPEVGGGAGGGIGSVLPGVENEKVRMLLDAILADERRHHLLLKKVDCGSSSGKTFPITEPQEGSRRLGLFCRIPIALKEKREDITRA